MDTLVRMVQELTELVKAMEDEDSDDEDGNAE
jgi:hypothetical protein